MLSFNASIAVCKAIIIGAKTEITGRNLSDSERFAVRGDARAGREGCATYACRLA